MLGDQPRALQWARRALAADPLREESHERLIRLLIAARQFDAAWVQCERAEQLLAHGLGATLPVEIRALMASLPPPSDRPPHPPPGGKRPRHLAKSPPAHPASGAEPGPAADDAEEEILASDGTRVPRATGNLPLRLNRFFGREREIARLRTLLLDPGTRLVTLTGPGGVGKTRLAHHLAPRLRAGSARDGHPLSAPAHRGGEPAFPGGVWFVSLLDLRDPALIPDQALQALRLARTPHQDALEQVAAFLSRAPTLLMLDNFEHLVESGAETVQSLLERVEHLTVLITSRQRLSLEGEHEFLVAPLPVPGDRRQGGGGSVGPDAADGVCRLLAVPSVALFVDRAQVVRADFQITTRNAAAVAGLCRQLEGLPLAIELAAARAGVLTPEQMLARLAGNPAAGGRLELLVGRRRGSDPRHHSLRTALDWSYDLLTPEVQRFFARLSVFRGGWTLEAPEAVCCEGVQVFGCSGVQETAGATLEHLNTRIPEHRTLECLEQLRECSLVEAEREGEAIRYHLLETMRQYGWQRLRESGEAEGAQRRHAAYYTWLAETAEAAWVTPDQGPWRDRVEREDDNMRAALAWYAECREAEGGMRLASALYNFWLARGHLTEARRHLEAMLALPGAERSKARVKALYTAGIFANSSGDLEAGARFHGQSLALARAIGDREGIAWAHHGLARGHGNQESLAIFRQLDHRFGIAHQSVMLGYGAVRRGDWRAARPLVAEGVALFREMGHLSATADALRVMSMVADAAGDLATAWRLCHESLALMRQLRTPFGIANSLREVGHVALRRQEWDAAQIAFDECLSLYQEMSSTINIFATLRDLGLVACGRQDWAAARAMLEQCLARSQNVDFLGLTVGALATMAEVVAGEGEAERGARLLGAAEALGEPIDRGWWPYNQEAYERAVAALRDALGEAAFEAARAAGRTLTLDQAIDLAVAGRLAA
jgi:predicted ATPase